MCGGFRFSVFLIFLTFFSLVANARDCEVLQIGEPVLEISWQNQCRREKGFHQAHLNYPYHKKGYIESCNPDGTYQILWESVTPLFFSSREPTSRQSEKRKDTSLYFKVSEKDYSSKWPTQSVQVSLSNYGDFPGFTFAQVKDYYVKHDPLQNRHPVIAEVLLSRLDDQPIQPGRLAYFFPGKLKSIPKPRVNLNRTVKAGFCKMKEPENFKVLFPSRNLSDHY